MNPVFFSPLNYPIF